MRNRWIRAAVLGAAAFFGLVGAHVLDYLLLYSDPVRRSGVLRQTGHAYFGKAIEFAIASAILAAIGSFAFGFLRERRDSSATHSTLRVAAVLALIQSGGFVALESAERVVANAHAGQMMRVLILGVVLQAAIATITASALRLLERAGEVVARALSSAPPVEQPVVAVVRPREAARPRFNLLSRASPRAPPLALVL